MDRINIDHLEYEEALKMLKEYSHDLASINLAIDFGVDHSQSKIIRDYIGYLFDTHEIKLPWKGRFILITDELINNAIEHGSTAWDLDTCIIQAGKGEDGSFSISLEVHDTGTGKDSENAKNMIQIKEIHAPKNDEPYMKKRGRGLFRITEKLVDRLEFTESPKWGLAVKIEKTIPENVIA